MITVRTCKSSEVIDYRSKKYTEFLNYYLNTDMLIKDIWSAIGVNRKNGTAKYIMRRLKADGHNSDIRRGKINKGEWV